MNETELYFARQNFLWDLGFYIIIGIGLIFIITIKISEIYDLWKWRKKK